jgi:hypothetical protein
VRVPTTADVTDLEVTVRVPTGPLAGEVTGWKPLTASASKK